MKKIFVLDTSVIIYDHKSITHFAEHDIVLPITVLEELDNFKKGSETKNFEAREFIRFLDKASNEKGIDDWFKLPGTKKGKFRVMMDTNGLEISAIKVFNSDTMDNKILDCCLKVVSEYPKRTVIFITKDINLRLKAKALGIRSEDYEAGKVEIEGSLSSGIQTISALDQDIINLLYTDGKVPKEMLKGKLKVETNAYYILQGDRSSSLAYYNPFTEELQRVNKQDCYGIKAKNAEQAFAMHAILNSDIKLVALHGLAGTGKTLLALAAALTQKKEYKQIYLARPIVPLSNKDIGYLPGDIKSKIDPYMQPLWDNLKVIQNQFEEQDKEHKQINIMLEQEKLLITPLAYIRGRSLSDIIFIVDEAQNLTPHEIKTIISRAGENSKFIFTGDIKQIDTPYLDEHSNGLSYLIDRVQGQKLFANVKLIKGERSELANLANELL